jgi:ribosomal protein S18 acetylase RimI-like enzyme
MNDLPESLFANPVWHALQTKHRHLAAFAADACRYPADVAPFAAVAEPRSAALQQLHSSLGPGESVWLIGKSYAHVPEPFFEGILECLQMVLPSGARSDGELIAMGGERLSLDGYPEISGVCTHPAHRGKRLAASLIWQLVRDHRRDGLVSWLEVGNENHRAIELYFRMGFKEVRKVTLHRISHQG